ncbi:hypothetical protein NQZ68_027001 [Dissostichus eleginoides]|nr:hypothetical protein NQZ68_027001 [Dissostichus eleginoides]
MFPAEPRQHGAAVCPLPAPSRIRDVRSQRFLPSAAVLSQNNRVFPKKARCQTRPPGPSQGSVFRVPSMCANAKRVDEEHPLDEQ